MKFEEKINLLIDENEVPECLLPENIAIMLKQKSAEKNIRPSGTAISMKSKKQAVRFRSSAAVAACVALVFGILAFVNDSSTTLPISYLSSAEEAKVAENYSDIYKAMQNIFMKNGSVIENTSPGTPDKNVITAPETPPQNGPQTPIVNTVVKYDATSEQIEGVADADIIRTDGKNLYYVANKALYMVSTDNGKMSLLSKLATDKNVPVEIYLEQDKLIVLSNNVVEIPYTVRTSETTKVSETTAGSEVPISETAVSGADVTQSSVSSESASSTSSGTSPSSAGTTSQPKSDTSVTETKIPSTIKQSNVVVEIYDITDKTSPKLVTTYKQNGSYISSKMLGTSLYLVTNYSGYQTKPLENQEDLDNYVPSYSINGNKVYIEAKDIIIPPSLSSTSYSVVSGLNILSVQPLTSIKAVLGSTKEIYGSSSNLYLVGNAPAVNDKDASSVTRFAIREGSVVFSASVVLEGTLVNSHSLNEYNGNFRLATTVNDSKSKKHSTNLYILGSDLKPTGTLTGLDADRVVTNVRFDKDIAYIMTSNEQASAIVSLTDQASPKLTGNTSAQEPYLRGYSDNRRIGFGREFDDKGKQTGIKLTMFDSSTGEPKELFSISLNGSLPAGLIDPVVDSNSLILDSAGGLIGIPAVSQGEYGYKNLYYVLSYDETSGFVQKGFLEYNDVDSHFSFNRALNIGDTFYALSSGRIVSAQLSDLKVIEALTLK